MDSLRGLANGLHYLHNFRPLTRNKEETERITRHGYHHDIKPKNILVKEERLILADFGLARLKDVQEDTLTPWKHAPPTYAAPEARDPVTLQERDIGRAYDIWSFGCVLGEFATYCLEGADTVKAFRKERIVDGIYGSHNCFHHDGDVNPVVHDWYRKMKDTYKDSSKSLLFDTSSWLLVVDPKQRPTSAELVDSFNRSSLSGWFLSVIFQSNMESSEDCEKLPPVYQAKLTLERNRLRAWGYSQGLETSVQQMQATGADLSDQYDSMLHLLKSCSVKLANLLPLRYNDVDDQEQVLRIMTSTNDALFLGTPHLLRTTIENTFQLFTVSATKTVKLLADPSNSTALNGGGNFLRNDQDTPQNREVGLLAAARYASLMLSSSDSLVSKGAITMIDPALLSDVNRPTTYASRLTTRWYYHGFRELDRQKVLVEERSYAGSWITSADEQTFADIGKEVLARVQELAQLFQMRLKPRDMRILQSLGAYHLPSQQRFGYVYEFPRNRSDAEPVSLATIIRETKEPVKNPTLNDKFALAQAVTSCIHSLHMTRWVHKDICSSNLTLLRDPEQDMTKVDLTQIYLTGFQHSRQWVQGAYSDGSTSIEEKAFIHPAYLEDGVGFHSAFEYYALGVVLLEIAIWRTVDKLFRPGDSPGVIRTLLLDYAQKYIPSRMGTGYCKVVLACMRFYDNHGDEKRVQNLLLRFQEEILEELHRSSLLL
jgi:serine/threonine protein kinase